MSEPKSLDQQIREARSSQEIADLQAQISGSVQRVEGGRALASPVMQAGRILVQCSSAEIAGTRDGTVNISAETLSRALEIDPNLKVIAMGGSTDSELENRIALCHDSAELTQLMVAARQGKI